MWPTFFVVVIFTYIVAVSRGQIPPFPDCTITDSATPFPQNIVFRAVILTQFGGIVALYLTQYYIFQSIMGKLKKQGINLKEFCTPKWINILASISIFSISIAVCTICAGYMNYTIHDTSAIFGFTVLFFTMGMIVVVYRRLQAAGADILISQKSLQFKTYLVYLMTAILIYTVTHPFLGATLSGSQIGVLEYSVFYSLVLYFATYTWDLENFYYFWSLSEMNKNDLQTNPIVNAIPILYQIPVQQQVQPNYPIYVQPQFVQTQQKPQVKQEIQMQTVNQNIIQPNKSQYPAFEEPTQQQTGQSSYPLLNDQQ